MIPEYIKYWISIVESMRNNNTYKLAWGRAILELVFDRDNLEEKLVDIELKEVAEKILKLYWNQTFFFNLKQGPVNSDPEILQIVKILISQYTNNSKSNIPVWFNEAINVLKTDEVFYNSLIKRVVRILKQDVSHRFMKSGIEILPLYNLDLSNEKLTFNQYEISTLKEYNYLLSQLLNYRWSQLLESFNRSPNITNKVKGSSQEVIRRKSLNKFKDILLEIYEDDIIIDFYTDKTIQLDQISVDHFVPWSFMYQDDLWNLVITSKSNNSSKSNKLISENYLDKLNRKNKELLNKLSRKSIEYLKLKEAVENDYAKSYYYDFKNTM